MSHAHGHHGAYTEETGSGWVMKGNHFYHTKEYQQALGAYQEALKREPLKTAIWNIHNRLCATYSRLKDYDNALKEAEAMIATDSTHPKGHIRKGGALFFLGRYTEALREYDLARTILSDPRSEGILTVERLEALHRYIEAAKAKLVEQGHTQR